MFSIYLKKIILQSERFIPIQKNEYTNLIYLLTEQKLFAFTSIHINIHKQLIESTIKQYYESFERAFRFPA